MNEKKCRLELTVLELFALSLIVSTNRSIKLKYPKRDAAANSTQMDKKYIVKVIHAFQEKAEKYEKAKRKTRP